MEFEQDFGVFIRTRLRSLNLTQSEAANRGGFTRQSLVNWMSGDVQHMKLHNIVRLASVLQVSPYYCLQYLCSELKLDIKRDTNTFLEKNQTSFARDVSVPHNSPVMARQEFFKQWEFMNTESVPWTDRYLQCIDIVPPQVAGQLVGGCLLTTDRCVPIPDMLPGERVVAGVPLIAPDLPGTVRSDWLVVDAQGEPLFPNHGGLSCQVRVLRM